jgi:hypothetical protein
LLLGIGRLTNGRLLTDVSADRLFSIILPWLLLINNVDLLPSNEKPGEWVRRISARV